MSELKDLILDIAMSSPGINHTQLVVRILRTGYNHTSGNLSKDVMKIVKRLVSEGAINKNPETRTILIPCPHLQAA